MSNKKLDHFLKYQEKMRLSISEHLKQMKIDESELENISRDNLILFLQKISEDGAHLNRPEIHTILQLFEFPPELSSDEDDCFKEIHGEIRTKHKKLRSVIEAGRNEKDYRELEKKIESISKKLEVINIKNTPDLKDLKEGLVEISKQSKRLAAPIKIPAPKDMEVQLVSADSLNRLLEHNSDINIFLTLASVFLGSFLGIFGNILFAESTSNQGYGVVAILAIVSIVFFILFKRASKRQKDLNESLLNKDDCVYINEYEV